MARTYLDFERPELDSQIEAALSEGKAVDDLEAKAKSELKSLYAKIGPWEKTHVARHPARPHYSAYIKTLISDYTPLAGDRKFGDDHALLGGLGKLRGRSVVVMGHEKGTTTETRLKHNFGMANPGRGAEERGQAEAIARSIDRGLSLRVPFISVITGEGGSGGAVAIATADKVMMLEHSIYSVISPEGCASILWRTRDRAKDAAKAMKITAQDLKRLGVIDQIVKEPVGGAHRTPDMAITSVGAEIIKNIESLREMSSEALIKARREKFLRIGRSLSA